MPTPERLAEQFEEHRTHVRAVAYRMLGSVNEAEDAVQEAWIRLSRTDVRGVDNLGMSRLVRGAQAVVAQAAAFSKLGLSSQVVLVNGNIGVVSRLPDGRPLSVIGFTIAGGKVVEMDILADPDRLSRLDLSAIER
jgi:hypothetical protein